MKAVSISIDLYYIMQAMSLHDILNASLQQRLRLRLASLAAVRFAIAADAAAKRQRCISMDLYIIPYRVCKIKKKKKSDQDA
jgi:hypothetical protein